MAKTKKNNTKSNQQNIKVDTPDDLHKLIEVEAYLIAEKRGFKGGDPVADWYMAETRVNPDSTSSA
jgi:hypothetical protein